MCWGSLPLWCRIDLRKKISKKCESTWEKNEQLLNVVVQYRTSFENQIFNLSLSFHNILKIIFYSDITVLTMIVELLYFPLKISFFLDVILSVKCILFATKRQSKTCNLWDSRGGDWSDIARPRRICGRIRKHSAFYRCNNCIARKCVYVCVSVPHAYGSSRICHFGEICQWSKLPLEKSSFHLGSRTADVIAICHVWNE